MVWDGDGVNIVIVIVVVVLVVVIIIIIINTLLGRRLSCKAASFVHVV